MLRGRVEQQICSFGNHFRRSTDLLPHFSKSMQFKRKTMKRSYPLSIIFLLFIVLSCRPTYTSIGHHSFPPQGERCHFDVFLTGPAKPYIEVGIVEWSVDDDGCTSVPRLDRFREEVGPFVCFNGGNGVIPYINDRGYYYKAIIIRT